MKINNYIKDFFNEFHDEKKLEDNNEQTNVNLNIKLIYCCIFFTPLVVFTFKSLRHFSAQIFQQSDKQKKIFEVFEKQITQNANSEILVSSQKLNEQEIVDPNNDDIFIENKNSEAAVTKNLNKQKILTSEDIHAKLEEWAKKEGKKAAVAVKKIKQALLSKGDRLDLSGLKLKSLPDEIGNLSDLKCLILRDNKLESLPDTIGNLSNLRHVVLAINPLKNLPDTIGNLSNLTRLNLSSNQLENLPDSIGYLSNLTDFNLFNNKLENLHDAIGNLSNLTNLNLTNNKLKNLPDTIGNLSNLETLNLGNNQLENLPDTISNLSNLTVLCFPHNKLKNLPSQIGRLSKLHNLSISSNLSLQELPLSLGQCPALTYLDNQDTLISAHTIHVNCVV